jgi:F-type H+-transporting ATPase subunit c
MTRKSVVAVFAIVLVLGMASMAFAEDGGAKAAGMWIFFAIALACGLGIGIAALGTGLGMGNAINAALSGIARNPEASGRIQTNMIFKIPSLDAVIKSLGG